MKRLSIVLVIAMLFLVGCKGNEAYVKRVNNFGTVTTTAIENFDKGVKVMNETTDLELADYSFRRFAFNEKWGEITEDEINAIKTLRPETIKEVKKITGNLKSYTKALSSLGDVTTGNDEAFTALAEAVASLDEGNLESLLGEDFTVDNKDIAKIVAIGRYFNKLYIESQISRKVPVMMNDFHPTFEITAKILIEINDKLDDLTEASYSNSITKKRMYIYCHWTETDTDSGCIEYMPYTRKLTHQELKSELKTLTDLLVARKTSKKAFKSSRKSFEKLISQHKLLATPKLRQCTDTERPNITAKEDEEKVKTALKEAKTESEKAKAAANKAKLDKRKAADCSDNKKLIAQIKGEVNSAKSFYDSVLKKLEEE